MPGRAYIIVRKLKQGASRQDIREAVFFSGLFRLYWGPRNSITDNNILEVWGGIELPVDCDGMQLFLYYPEPGSVEYK